MRESHISGLRAGLWIKCDSRRRLKMRTVSNNEKFAYNQDTNWLKLSSIWQNLRIKQEKTTTNLRICQKKYNFVPNIL